MMMIMMMMIVIKSCLLQNLQAFLDLNVVAQEIQVAVMVEDTQVISPKLRLKTCRKFLAIDKGKGKSVPLQAWTGAEGSRKLRFLGFVTTAQDGGKVVSLTHRMPLPPGNTPGTYFC